MRSMALDTVPTASNQPGSNSVSARDVMSTKTGEQAQHGDRSVLGVQQPREVDKGLGSLSAGPWGLPFE